MGCPVPAGRYAVDPAASDRLRQVSWPGIECHRDYIAGQLKAGVTVATIHQRLADEHRPDASVASVRRWVRANLVDARTVTRPLARAFRASGPTSPSPSTARAA